MITVRCKVYPGLKVSAILSRGGTANQKCGSALGQRLWLQNYLAGAHRLGIVSVAAPAATAGFESGSVLQHAQPGGG